MTERLDIDVLRTLKAVHDYGGVTRAAEHLSLTQSAVSHKLRRFEQNLGCELLRRKPGQGLLTIDGQQLVAYAEKIISIHDEALSSIKKPALSGSIRLGITEELVTSGLANVLGRFSRLYPGVKVITRVEQSLVLNEQLVESFLDMVVMQIFKHDVTGDDLVLQEDELVWVKSIDYKIPDDNRIPFIAFDKNCFYRQWASKELVNSNLQLDVVLECASNEGVCGAVSAGMGVALIAERHLRSDMEKLSILEAPNIIFVVRTGNTERSNHLSVLRDDIFNSLAT